MNSKLRRQLEKIKPVKTYTIGTVNFYIYKAKSLHSSRWHNQVLKKIVLRARRSFLRYGAVPLLNRHDALAEIYLCRASDDKTEEWLCVRFVPGMKGRHIVEDLDQYTIEGKPAADFLRKKLRLRQRSYEKALVSISRVCSIAPYHIKRTSRQNKSDFSKSLQYGAQSFAFINKYFFSQCNFTYLVGSFRKELLKKFLAFNPDTVLHMTDAYQILGCMPKDVRLNRARLAYRFPGYFLYIPQLLDLFETLIKEKFLRVASIKCFVVSYRKNFNEYLAGKNYQEVLQAVRGVHKLLLAPGKIPYSQLTGVRLRQLVADQVDDGPALKIVKVADWKKQLEAINY